MSETIKEWWYAKDSERHGPLTREALKTLADSGALLGEDLVWKQSMTEWVPAATIEHLFGNTVALPPPLPTKVPVAAPAASSSPSAPSLFTSPNGESLDDCVRAYVGKNQRFYFSYWWDLHTKGATRSWNWAAFFFGLSWMAYRKMYAYCAGFIGFMVLETLVAAILGIPFRVLFFGNLAVDIFVGLYANHWYKRHAEQRVRRITASGCNLEWAQTDAARAGGTSLLAAIGVTVLAVFVLVLMFH